MIEEHRCAACGEKGAIVGVEDKRLCPSCWDWWDRSAAKARAERGFVTVAHAVEQFIESGICGA